MQLLTTLFQELLTQISPRAGFGAQGYLDNTGIISGAWVWELY